MNETTGIETPEIDIRALYSGQRPTAEQKNLKLLKSLVSECKTKRGIVAK